MTKKVFYYYEVDIPQDVIDAHEATGDQMTAASVLKYIRRQYIADTDSKNAKIIEEFIFACSAYYGFNGTRSAVSLEFLTDRDFDRHQTVLQEFKDHLASEYNIQYVYETKRAIDSEGMLVREEGDEPGTLGNNTYWKTKEYFNETLPAERGFATTCLLEDANGTETWMEYWLRDK